MVYTAFWAVNSFIESQNSFAYSLGWKYLSNFYFRVLGISALHLSPENDPVLNNTRVNRDLPEIFCSQ
jgi:hypothetical protein